jgi:glycosyltransferase involved in cell wall biosynthesis
VHNGLLPAELSGVEPVEGAADLLFLGELRRLKGVDLLLDAVATLSSARPCRLLIVGAGPDETEFRQRCATLGLSDRVTFAGPMPAAEAFRLGRALVLPSRAESFPYLVLEATAAGLPIVAADVGGIGEIVSGTDTRLVRPNDVAALTAAIADVLRSPTAARERAGRLASSVARRFTVEAMTDGALGVYAEALGRPRTVPVGDSLETRVRRVDA